jgi:hypothetical protein
MSSGVIDLNELKQKKQEILERKRTIDKNDIEAIKEILREYMRIQKKIQYYSNEEYRKQKNIKDLENHKNNPNKYKEYHRYYYQLKKLQTTN